MKETIFDYSNLYIHCGFALQINDKWYRDIIVSVNDEGGFWGEECDITCDPNDFLKDKENKNIFLILRELSTLSDEIRSNYYNLCHRINDTDGTHIYTADTPESLRYLLSRGVDCFNLIERGIAISEETAKTYNFEPPDTHN